jgi:hypothetical protein
MIQKLLRAPCRTAGVRSAPEAAPGLLRCHCKVLRPARTRQALLAPGTRATSSTNGSRTGALRTAASRDITAPTRSAIPRGVPHPHTALLPRPTRRAVSGSAFRGPRLHRRARGAGQVGARRGRQDTAREGPARSSGSARSSCGPGAAEACFAAPATRPSAGAAANRCRSGQATFFERSARCSA